MRKKAMWVALGAAIVMIAGAVAVTAQGGSDRAGTEGGEPVVATSSGQSCGMGVQTQNTGFDPDQATGGADLAATATSTVKLRKPCLGPTTAIFSSEVSGAGAITTVARATCVKPGGLPGGCTAGADNWAFPGGTPTDMFFGTGDNTTTRTVQFLWPKLARGVWRFEVLTGADAGTTLVWRQLTVTSWERA